MIEGSELWMVGMNTLPGFDGFGVCPATNRNAIQISFINYRPIWDPVYILIEISSMNLSMVRHVE
jgi:hypothetical protein